MTTTGTTPTDRITLTGLSARGRHGVLPLEREEGQVFVVDVVMDLGPRGSAVAALTDSLEDAVDYSVLASRVVAVIEGEPVGLIETLASRVADVVLATPRVLATTVTVHKPEAPLDVAFEDVSVTVHRDAPSGQAALPSTTQQAAPAPEPAPAAEPAAEVAAPVEVDEPAEATPLLEAPVLGAVGAAALGGAVVAEPDEEDLVVELPAEPATPEPAAVVPVEPEPATDPLVERPAQPVPVVLALGGNVGAVLPALRRAVAALKATEGLSVTSVAPLARTAAVTEPGRGPQPDYLNTVVLATTTLSPRELLDVAMSLEKEAGRVRTESRGPRTLDVDLIDYEGVTSEDPALTLPHPRAHERAFVLAPWAAADDLAEIGGQSVAQLAEYAPDREGLRWLALDWVDSDHLPALPTGQYVAPPLVTDEDDEAGAAGVEGAGQAAAEAAPALAEAAPAQTGEHEDLLPAGLVEEPAAAGAGDAAGAAEADDDDEDVQAWIDDALTPLDEAAEAAPAAPEVLDAPAAPAPPAPAQAPSNQTWSAPVAWRDVISSTDPQQGQ